jgi:hypothetical protein
MISTTGIIPETLMYPQCKKSVIDFLLAQPFTSELKERLLEGWALTVGVRVRPREFHIVEASGVDYQQGAI